MTGAPMEYSCLNLHKQHNRAEEDKLKVPSTASSTVFGWVPIIQRQQGDLDIRKSKQTA